MNLVSQLIRTHRFQGKDIRLWGKEYRRMNDINSKIFGHAPTASAGNCLELLYLSLHHPKSFFVNLCVL